MHSTIPGETNEAFPDIWMPPVKQGAKGRTYEIGGPWTKEAMDFSSTQGQILYVPDKGFGVDRVTILEMSNNTYSEKPEPPWWGGFRPEPHSAAWVKAGGDALGAPVCMARGMGNWANCGVIVFSSGLLSSAGTCTANGSNPTMKLPAGKIPTAISITPKSEFAFITVYDSEKQKGQLAVIALECNGRGFAHEWKEAHPGLCNVAIFTGFKLLGFVDLPEMTIPTAVCAVGNTLANRLSGGPGGHQGTLSQYDLNKQSDRDLFGKGENGNFSASAGFVVVVSKYDQKVAFIDLQPLFARVREMYFTTQENYDKTRDQGPDPKQWPYTFDVDPALKPVVVKVVSNAVPTAVLASMAGGPKARAFVASLDGKVTLYEVGGLATDAPASPDDIRPAGEVQVGRNPVCLAYHKGSINTAIAVSRGDREIAWIQYSDKGVEVVRRLRDARMLDPVFVEHADTHGTETAIITVADFKGRKIINYRYSDIFYATNGGARFGMGPDGKAEVECGGFLEFPGSPFALSATNVN